MKQLMILCLLVSLVGCNFPDGTSKTDSWAFESATDDFEEVVDIPATHMPEATEVFNADRKLIKKAQLQFETKDLKATTSKLRTLSARYGGYISDETLENLSDQHWNRVQIKVPSEHFDELIDQVSSLADKFELMEVSSQDVTEEYTDLQARIATKKRVEQRYLQILANAKTIEEILKVEAKVAEVREEIERAEGRVRYLNTRASMSSIHLAYYQIVPFTEPVIEEPTFITHLVEGLENGVNILKGLLIGLANVWPLILLIGTVIFIYRKKWKKAAPAAS